VYCGPCLVEWFTSQRATTCPACRVDSVNLPQRDYALSDILPLVYEAQGATVPTIISENFDPKIFVTIYADKAALLVGRQGGGLGRLGGGPGRPGGGPGRPGGGPGRLGGGPGRLGGGQVTRLGHSVPPPDVIDVDMEEEI
jgi:hypothetical protein